MLGPDARYEQRESTEFALAAALQHLPALQRAVLILRDVLGFPARETAEALEMTPVSVDSALQRAHKSIENRVSAQTQQATPLERAIDRLQTGNHHRAYLPSRPDRRNHRLPLAQALPTLRSPPRS
jgi:RNA polymerase sigma-70 factor, ECF subfamily